MAFSECLARVKAAAPEFAGEKNIIISAQPAIPVAQIIGTIDAARSSFPTVAFGLSR